ncbi:MAG: zinc-ribbon domain-containing protein, partial [Dehalococcoidia bacterium]|nr:zinc-ribbon domain-containing protein [Dehalococcoidia bacterium]
MSYQDRTLACVDCNVEFTFTAAEQEFYAKKGFTNDPKRCPTCRAAKKQQ